ncbi:Ankyrin repeat and protein kinase domain-containing protein 1 [Symbiodinium microadriaticum]|uniref:Ankyrin repeat and protein kinase domain-containing protein 1 n=1 Tax=Symbiodinium microadriaticum TaxID=2951 RepID=A0A1Q9C4H4_SYMMI|nr:Ankyrin repeat and protein kinase domain-containing protein 1 [Symbiodinium microadriaticum]CAE7612740.1 ANKK1 [Symbiodinium microadriaticum]CAE7881152.1 ANKK1 [Symbiodinium sp. KB8]
MGSRCSASQGDGSTPSAGDATMFVHPQFFPLYVVKITDLLTMEMPAPSHTDLLNRGLLHSWQPGMFSIFLSHQWLGRLHPDPEGSQLNILRESLLKLTKGSVSVECNLPSMMHGQLPHWSADMAKRLENGFIFLDWFSIPEIIARESDSCDDESCSTTMAVRSIPFYVEACDLFFVLAPELRHKDTGRLCNYASWLSRGWCRAELWCRLLSAKTDTSVVVVYSAEELEFMFQLDWQHNTIADGVFTVEADRGRVVSLGEAAAEGKLRQLRQSGHKDVYRFFLAHRHWLLGRPRHRWQLQDFLNQFHFDDLEAAAGEGVMTGVLCAVFAGDSEVLTALVGARADVNSSIRGLSDLGYFDGMSPLTVATRSNQDPEMLSTLLKLRADVNYRVPMSGACAAHVARSSEQFRVLKDAGVDFHSVAMPIGMTPLTSAAGFAAAEVVSALLEARSDPNPPMQGCGWSPLHAVALFSRGRADAVEIVHLLVKAQGDLNAKARMSGPLSWIARAMKAQTAIWGLSACGSKARCLASLPGITPLGAAALVGDETLTGLFLDLGARSAPNDMGSLPEELAQANRHANVTSLLDFVSI